MTEVAAESLWQTVKRDFSGAAGLKLLGVVLLLAWMAFQWGFGNDALLPSIAATAFDSVDDGETWLAGFGGVATAMAASFVFWGATQAFDAVITMAGLGLLPGLTDRISAYLQRKGWVTPYRDMKWSTRWLIAYATGVSVLCLIDRFATGDTGIRGRKHLIVTATLLSAGTVAAVVGVITTAAMVGTRIPATEDATQVLIRYAKNPLTWIVIFGSVYAISALRSSLGTNESETATSSE